MVGRTIGKYRIVEQIGRGGMGTVYKAIDETLDRRVAIKILNADLIDQEAVERFRREAMTLAKLNHGRIGAIHELTRDGHDLLMVMEFLEGETFEKLIERGPMEIPRAVTLCEQVLDALQYAHSAGVIHRDLKPANVMLTPSGTVKVMDFGIARVQGSEHLTTNGFMVGTPAYMAPEQVRGEEVDPRMDLYAIAVVLYRMLTHRLPFNGDTAIAMIHSQLNNWPTPPRQFRADLPDWLVSVIDRGLAKTPADRFNRARIRNALEAGLSGRQPRRPSTSTKRLARRDSGPMPRRRPRRGRPPPRRSRRRSHRAPTRCRRRFTRPTSQASKTVTLKTRTWRRRRSGWRRGARRPGDRIHRIRRSARGTGRAHRVRLEYDDSSHPPSSQRRRPRRYHTGHACLRPAAPTVAAAPAAGGNTGRRRPPTVRQRRRRQRHVHRHAPAWDDRPTAPARLDPATRAAPPARHTCHPDAGGPGLRHGNVRRCPLVDCRGGKGRGKTELALAAAALMRADWDKSVLRSIAYSSATSLTMSGTAPADIRPNIARCRTLAAAASSVAPATG